MAPQAACTRQRQPQLQLTCLQLRHVMMAAACSSHLQFRIMHHWNGLHACLNFQVLGMKQHAQVSQRATLYNKIV